MLSKGTCKWVSNAKPMKPHNSVVVMHNQMTLEKHSNYETEAKVGIRKCPHRVQIPINSIK
jgi:hypothetical protein